MSNSAGMADASAPIDFRLLTQTAQRTFSERFPQKERRKGGEEGEEEGEEEEEEEAELEEGGSGGGGGGGRETERYGGEIWRRNMEGGRIEDNGADSR